MNSPAPHTLLAIVFATVTVTLTMMVLDLSFLGVVAKSFYDTALGSLKRPTVHWPAALAFYAMYVGAITAYAVVGAEGLRDAFSRGAALGFVCYATYELTNWAVLAGWPARLVAVDIVWGVMLTGMAAFAGRAALERAATALR